VNRPTVATTSANLETLLHLNPKSFEAVRTLVDEVLRTEKRHIVVECGVRGGLLSRLQAVHDCQHEDGGAFEQIEPLGRIRQWKCSGCGRIVALESR
jgi:hypothetical protein